jgi:DNA-binding beta-propeller fold protein YncE
MRPAVLSSGPSRPSCPYDVRGSDVQYEDARYPGPQTPHTSAWTSRCPLGLALALAAVAALLLASGWGSGTEGHAPGDLGGALAAGGSRVRVFVASETTNQVWVFEGAGRTPVATLPVGHHPHNLGASPDGRWVATAARESDEVSLIDVMALVEVARVKVPRAPHDVVFSPDSRTLYVSQEAAPVVSVIDVIHRRRLPPLYVGVPQHDLAVTPDGRELWMTVTGVPMSREPRRVWIVDLPHGKVTARLNTGRNAHDVIFTPEGERAWVTNSGIPAIPDNHITVLDVRSRRVAADLVVGRYPFHAPKQGRDGRYVPPHSPLTWFSDHGLRAIVGVDRRTGRVVAVITAGREPYHIAPAPNGWLYVAANASDWVAVIDPVARRRVGILRVPRPHGIAVLGLR